MYLCVGEAKAAASRRLLVEDEPARPLGAPDPVCQFCEMAVSYVKVHLLQLQQLPTQALCQFRVSASHVMHACLGGH